MIEKRPEQQASKPDKCKQKLMPTAKLRMMRLQKESQEMIPFPKKYK